MSSDPRLPCATRPTRAVLNFAHKCALRCEWCYVPFNTLAPSESVVSSIIDRVSDLGFRAITIGGGDPFQYAFIERIIRRASGAPLFVHVDTHAKSLSESPETMKLLFDAVDLLGLPLDGPSAIVHDEMRSSPGHFELMQRRFRWLQGFRERLKINTILSSRNIGFIDRLADLVQTLAPARWSIYQYWPLGPAARAVASHGLCGDEFLGAANRILSHTKMDCTTVEINREDDRRLTYPIVHHDGTIYVHSSNPSDDFRSLGSIFDDSAVVRLFASCHGERARAATRYL
jgi:MoaA/NifB/PqqE/SkfB family radical SAM enzyme